MAKKYHYIGNGQGVPGLPNEITDEEAKALGDTGYPDPGDKSGQRRLSVFGLLQAAVKAGTFAEVKAAAKKSSEGG